MIRPVGFHFNPFCSCLHILDEVAKQKHNGRISQMAQQPTFMGALLAAHIPLPPNSMFTQLLCETPASPADAATSSPTHLPAFFFLCFAAE